MWISNWSLSLCITNWECPLENINIIAFYYSCIILMEPLNHSRRGESPILSTLSTILFPSMEPSTNYDYIHVCMNFSWQERGDPNNKRVYVSPVARRYTRVVNGRERLVVCLSEYLPLRILHVHDSSLVVCFSNISAYFA